MVVCDRDGVVVVPFERIDDVAEKLMVIKNAETKVEAAVKAGMSEPEYIAELMSSERTRYVD